MAKLVRETKRVSPLRRWLHRAAVYLVLGFVSCVLVTWWMALVRPWNDMVPNIFGRQTFDKRMECYWGPLALHEYTETSVFMLPTAVRDIVSIGVGPLRHETEEARREGVEPQTHEDFELKFRRKLQHAASEYTAVARAARAVPIVMTVEGRLRRFQESCWGWPMRCFSSSVAHRWTLPDTAAQESKIEGWVIIRTEFDDPRFILPYTPVWPGLIVNTLLYAAAIGAIVESMMFAVPARRRRAERCVKCGYSRKGLAPGSPCPECGAEPALRSAGVNP